MLSHSALPAHPIGCALTGAVAGAASLAKAGDAASNDDGTSLLSAARMLAARMLAAVAAAGGGTSTVAPGDVNAGSITELDVSAACGSDGAA